MFFHLLRRGWFGRAMEMGFDFFVRSDYIPDAQWGNHTFLYMRCLRQHELVSQKSIGQGLTESSLP